MSCQHLITRTKKGKRHVLPHRSAGGANWVGGGKKKKTDGWKQSAAPWNTKCLRSPIGRKNIQSGVGGRHRTTKNGGEERCWTRKIKGTWCWGNPEDDRRQERDRGADCGKARKCRRRAEGGYSVVTKRPKKTAALNSYTTDTSPVETQLEGRTGKKKAGLLASTARRRSTRKESLQ